MIRKLFILLFCISLISAVSAAEVVYVVKNTAGADPYLIDQIESNGFSVETITESQVLTTNFDDYRLIVVGSQDFVTPLNIPVYTHPSILVNTENAIELGWSSSKSTSPGPTALKNLNSDTGLGNNVPLNFNSYTVSGTTAQTYFIAGKKATGLKMAVSKSGSTNDIAVAGMDKGMKYLNNKVAQQRSVFFGITKAQYWTPESKKLFANSLSWVIKGSDFDKDGHFSEFDCNDQDAEIFPGAEEIAYDGIDQDCNGYDLLDLDSDGFCSEDLTIQNKSVQCSLEKTNSGSDCDDSSFITNPKSTNLTLNCVNDMPQIKSVRLNPTFQETEQVKIEVLALDFEGDDLIYSINDARFEEISEGVFIWNTGYEDSGEYNLKISVTDGQFKVTREVHFRIINKNRIPILTSDIPDIQGNEDENLSINLNSYFIDEDLDALSFGLNATSDNKQVLLEISESGIATFVPAKDWYGEDWVILSASDGKGKVLSNKLNLEFLPVNDAPVFKSDISDLEWSEDSSISIDLSNYFEDIDSEIEYSVVGNQNIDYSISGSVLTLTPRPDWHDEETIMIEASDGEFTVSSNMFSLFVYDAGEIPVIESLDCQTEILEDESYTCEIISSDFDNDEITLSLSEKSNIDCSLSGNTISYQSSKDYNGLASCKITATDKDGSSSKILEVNILPVNDAPEITSYSPKENSINIPSTETKKFSISTEDIDNQEIFISWELNGEIVSNSNKYDFKKSEGLYELTAFVSDSEDEVSHSWTIVVGPTSDFTCSEVSGFACSEEEICLGSQIGVSDTFSCCSIACSERPPEFNDANTCELKSSDLILEITNPDTNEEFDYDDSIKVKVNLENLGYKQDFDIGAYLYDISSDESLEDKDESIDLDSGESDKVEFELEIPEDIDFDNEYAIFVVAEGNVCTQEYQKIKVERPENKLIIDKINFPNVVSCGEIVEGSVKIENIGREDEEATLSLTNTFDNSSYKSESFTIEEAGDDDKQTIPFSFSIPESIKSGEYEMIASVSYGEKAYSSINFNIDCELEKVQASENQNTPEIMKLNSRAEGQESEYFLKNLTIMTLLTILVSAFLLMFLTIRNRILENKRLFDFE